jgi:hypothetical protein
MAWPATWVSAGITFVEALRPDVPREPSIPLIYSVDMTLLRMDNVLVVVDDLKAAIAFFAELGLEPVS